MLASMPVERVSVHIDAHTRVSYYVGGDPGGVPVVLLHGGGTDHALLSWRETLPALIDAGFRVLAPDHPGYGHSPLPASPVTMSSLVSYVARFVDALGLRQPALVGVSMGGALALGYALAVPHNVGKLVLVGSYGIQDTAPLHTMSFFMVRVPGITALSSRLIRASRWLVAQTVRQIIRNPESRTPELTREVQEALKHKPSQQAFNQWQRDEIQWGRTRTNFTKHLHAITQPTLIVHGSEDIGVPLAAARRAAAQLPHAHLEVFTGAGHWTQRDEPVRFNQLLCTFLEQP